MHPWVSFIGFPVVNVEPTAAGLRLTQNRFLSSGDPSPAEDGALWPIPLNVQAVGGGKVHRVLMTARTMDLALPDAMTVLYKLNTEMSGVFRVRYSPAYLARLAAATFPASGLASPLSVADQLGLVQDALVLAPAGYSTTCASLEFLRSLAAGHERSYLVWFEAAEHLRQLLDAWWERPADELAAVRAFARALFAPLRDEVGLAHEEGDDVERRMMRILVVAALAQAEDPAVLAHLQQQFLLLAAGQADPASAPADLVGVIVAESVAHGGAQFYGIAQAIYAIPPTPAHKLAAIAGLTSVREPALVQQTAGMLLSGAVAEQDMSAFLVGLARNPASRRMMWGYLQQEWPMLHAKFAGTHSLGAILQWSFQLLSSTKDADAVEAFFADVDCEGFEGPLKQAIETVRTKAKWIERDADGLREWLSEQGYLGVGDAG